MGNQGDSGVTTPDAHFVPTYTFRGASVVVVVPIAVVPIAVVAIARCGRSAGGRNAVGATDDPSLAGPLGLLLSLPGLPEPTKRYRARQAQPALNYIVIQADLAP